MSKSVLKSSPGFNLFCDSTWKNTSPQELPIEEIIRCWYALPINVKASWYNHAQMAHNMGDEPRSVQVVYQNPRPKSFMTHETQQYQAQQYQAQQYQAQQYQAQQYQAQQYQAQQYQAQQYQAQQYQAQQYQAHRQEKCQPIMGEEPQYQQLRYPPVLGKTSRYPKIQGKTLQYPPGLRRNR